ncbi:MAG: host attachment protein [Luteolibacter sp.]|nr:host attachment protein [Luteolibacter sp.]
MKKIIIAANLGNLRVLKYREAGEDPIEQEHLIEEAGESGKVHVKSMQETVTDQAGRFARGGAVGFETGMSHGEEHHLQDEIERNALRQIAARVEYALAAEGHPPWILAAPKPILSRLKGLLSQDSRNSLSSSVGADLTRSPLVEMEKRFL